MLWTPPSRRRAPSIEALEPRLLFSADPVGVADALAVAWVASAAPEAIAWQVRSPAGTPVSMNAEAVALSGGVAAAARELALVDDRVPDAGRLLAELDAQRAAGRPIDVLVVGDGDDAIAALDAALSGAQGTYRAVHLFGHGEPGSMLLGDGSLDLATLRARAGEVAGWSLGLTEGADLLLWGCDAGEGAEGAALLDALSALTGADVAASTDATGGSAAGGNWVLEVSRGSIEATAPIGAALRAEFAGRLGLTPAPSGEVLVASVQTQQENTDSVSTAGRQVAASAAGTVLVWIDADGERILAQRYAVDGSSRGGVLTINDDDNDDDDDDDDDDAGARMPAVAMDDAGNVLVAWSNARREVRVSYVSAAEADRGLTDFDGTSSKVNQGNGAARGVTWQVSIDLSPNGQRAVVVWAEVSGDTARRNISARRLSIDPASGVTMDGPQIAVTDVSDQRNLAYAHPDAGIADDGAITIVYQSLPNTVAVDGGILSRQVAAGSSEATPAPRTTIGDRVSPAQPLGNSPQIAPSFALGTDGRGLDGRGLAVWVDNANGTSLWARVIGSSGPIGAAVKLPTDAQHVVGRPSVAAIAGGGWVVAWDTTPRADNGIRADYGIRAILVDATGTPEAGGPTYVDMTSSGDQRAPSVAVAGSSRVVIAWTGPGGGLNSPSALVMRTFDLGGALAIDPVPRIDVRENATAITVALRATVDGDPQTGVAWSLAPSAPAGLLTIDAATGVLTVLAGLDYETLAGGTGLEDGRRAYDVVVAAAIDGITPRTATTTVRVVLGNVREAPRLTVPPTVAAVEDVTLVLSDTNGTAVSVDADAAATRLEVVLSVDRGTLTLGAFEGLDFSGGSDGTNDATIRFGGSPAAVAAALASLTFRPEADASGAATITLAVTDAGPDSRVSQATIVLTIAAVNDAPVAGPLAQPVAVEAGSLLPVGPGVLAATDVDDGSDRIVYELAEPSALGDLLRDGVALVAGARFTQADVDLGRLSFDAREVGTANVSLRLADAGGAMAGTTTLTFEVKARTLAPVLAIDPVPRIDVRENATAITVALRATVDGDPQTGVAWSLAPSAPAGLLTIDAATGVLTVLAGLDYETLAGGTGLEDGRRAYDVVVAAAIDGITPRTATTTVRVVLGNVREAPRLAVPPTVAAVEDVTLVLSDTNGTAVSVDADAAATRLESVLSVDRGTLTLGAFEGLDFSGGSDGTNDATIRFGGSPSAVAAALASLTFRPEADASGAATITLAVTDAGPDSRVSQATIVLTIAAVNDAPVAGPLAQPVAVEAGSLLPVGLRVLAATDVDDGPDRIVYELAEPSALGDLLRDGVALVAGARFTQADVDLGRLSFAAREAGTANVSLRLADAGGTTAGTTTLTFEVKARPLAPVLEAAPPAPPAPVEEVVVAAPIAAASPPTFATSRTTQSFASLSSASQSDGIDAGSTRASGTQISQQASDGGSGSSSGLSVGLAAAQPAGVAVRMGAGGTSAGGGATAATAAAPVAAAPVAAATVGGAAGSVQSGASAAVGLQAFASVAATAAQSAAGAQIAWQDTGSEATSEAQRAGGPAAGAGSSTSSGALGAWTRARSGAPSGAALPIDAWSPAVALRQADFRAELAQTREQAAARFETNQTLVASSVAISTSLSIGYVVWLARGGVLLTSLLASMPAWRSIDPLPVLARVDARGRDDAENDDSLRGLLKGAADRRAAQAQAQAEAEAQAGVGVGVGVGAAVVST
jgi:hypothetical protein